MVTAVAGSPPSITTRAWIPVFCRGKRKSGVLCLNIVGYKRDAGYIAESFLTMCKRCKLEQVVK